MAVVILVFLILPSPISTGATDVAAPQGAWLQIGVKWKNAPRDINPRLQAGQGEILYFGKNGSFAIIDCTIGREPKNYEIISHGDPKGVYLGEWQRQGDTIAVIYRLEFRTIRIRGERLPGPVYHSSVKVLNRDIRFNNLVFRRDPSLDVSAEEELSGTRVPKPTGFAQ